MNLYEYWDSLSAECDNFHEYAWNHLEEFLTELEQNKYRKITSTYGSDLGIASPSKMTKYIVKNINAAELSKM